MCGVHRGFPELLGVHFTKTLIAVGFDVHAAHFGNDLLFFLLGVGVALVSELCALAVDFIERRLCEEHVTVLDQLLHVTEEEGEQQDADVRAVDVGVRHNDNLAVAQLGGVEFLTDAAAQRLNDRNEREVGIHLVQSRFFHVEHLTAQRQDRLEARVSALLCRASCRVSLHQIELGELGVFLLTVGKLARQRGALEQSLATGCLACLSRRLTRTVCRECLVENCLANAGIFLKIFGKLFGDKIIDVLSHLAVSELALGLTLKLCLGELDRNHR